MLVNTEPVTTEIVLKTGGNISTNYVVTSKKVSSDDINAENGYIENLTSVNANISNLDANTIDATNVSTDVFNAQVGNITEFTSTDAQMETLKSTDGRINNLYNDYFYSNSSTIDLLKALIANVDEGYIDKLTSDRITTNRLDVLQSAHFFELVIDQIKAAGGAFILSPADGFKIFGYIDYSDYCDLYYKCQEDDNGRYNMWEVGDFALCQNFNNADVDENYDISNTFWWARVEATSNNPTGESNINNPHPVWVLSEDDPEEPFITISDNQYDITHPTWRRGDFMRYDSVIYKDNNNNIFLTVPEYNELPDEQKSGYSQYGDPEHNIYAWIRMGEDGNATYISQQQHDGLAALNDGHYLYAYCKADATRCHWIRISKVDCHPDSEFEFKVGDDVAMLGNDTDTTRQAAIYLSAYNSIDSTLTAPLIAQYRGINEFNLSSHKWSWFDANGATFKGTFLTVAGDNIENEIINIDTNYYRFIPSKSTITRDINNIQSETISLQILYKDEHGDIQMTNYVPTGMHVDYTHTITGSSSQSDTISAGGSLQNISLPSDVNWTSTRFELWKGIDDRFDVFVLNVNNIENGEDGGHYEFRYKNAVSQPDAPTGNGTTGGWSAQATTPDFANNYKTWMSQCLVSGDGTYATWSVPIRISGDNGQNGVDGNSTEFIYRRTTSASPVPSISYTANQGKTRDDDDFVPIDWTDDPQGVNQSYPYEWVATRTKSNGTWGNFSTPAIWANYAPGGQAGPAGPAGRDAKSEYLIPNVELIEARLDTSSGTNPFATTTAKLYVDLSYSLVQVEGTVTTYLDWTSSGYNLILTCDKPSNVYIESSPPDGGDWTFTSSNATYTNNNILTVINPSTNWNSNYRNYQFLMENYQTSGIADRTPTFFTVELYNPNNVLIEKREIPVTYATQSIWQNTKNGITSVQTSSQTYTDNANNTMKTYVDNKFTTIEQTSSGISARVGDLETDSVSVHTSLTEIDAKADVINTRVSTVNDTLTDRLDYDNMLCVQLDLKSFDQNTYYPCTIDMSNVSMLDSKTRHLYTFQVDRPLDTRTSSAGYGTPSWGRQQNTSNIPDGVSLMCAWQQYQSGWGTYDGTYIYVLNYDLKWALNSSVKVIGNIEQYSPKSTVVFYLRGGSKYNVRTDAYNIGTDKIQVHQTGVTIIASSSEQKTYNVITNDSDINLPVIDKRRWSEITQTAENISMNVYDEIDDKLLRTGIDITNRNIDINADNTNFYGNIKLFNSNDGLTIFNDDNQVAVNIQKSSIGNFGANQNTTNVFNARSGCYTYVANTNWQTSNSSMVYVGSYDTTNCYVSPSANTGTAPLKNIIGTCTTGNVLNFNDIKFTITGDANTGWSGNINDYKAKFVLYWLNSDHSVINRWITPTRNSSGEFSIPNQSYTVGDDANGQQFTVIIYLKGPNTPIDNTQNKYMSFTSSFTMTNTISINTKIGIDGMYSVNNNGEFWVGNDNIGMYYKNTNNSLYGSGKNVFGQCVTSLGGGVASGNTLSYLSQWDNYGCLKISGSTSDTIANRLNGKVGWSYTTGSFAGREGGYNEFKYTGRRVPFNKWPHPKVLFVNGVTSNSDYLNLPYVIKLETSFAGHPNLWNDSDYAPAGHEVHVYNYMSKDLYVVADEQNSTISESMYCKGQTSIKRYVKINSRSYGHFVCLGDGKWLATVFDGTN